jgi:hypothetical protein
MVAASTISTREKEAVMFGSCSGFAGRHGVDGRDKRGHDAENSLLVTPNSESWP